MLDSSKKSQTLKATLSNVKNARRSDVSSKRLTPLEVIKGRGVQSNQKQEQIAAGKKGPYLMDNLRGAVDKANVLSGKPTNYNTPKPLSPALDFMMDPASVVPYKNLKKKIGPSALKQIAPAKPSTGINKPASPVLSPDGQRKRQQMKDALIRGQAPKATSTPELKEKFAAPAKSAVRAISSTPVRIK